MAVPTLKKLNPRTQPVTSRVTDKVAEFLTIFNVQDYRMLPTPAKVLAEEICPFSATVNTYKQACAP